MIFSEKNYENIILALVQRELTSGESFIAIDEIQLHVTFQVIKYLYDNYDIKFIVTGSSSFYLKICLPKLWQEENNFRTLPLIWRIFEF
jgi:hypothetical protein